MKSPQQTPDLREAFSEFYEQNLARVYQYIHFKVNDTRVAEDLTSTVFERSLARFNAYDSNVASRATWVMAIARNTVIDYFRVNSGRQNVALQAAEEIESDFPSPERAAERKAEQECLLGCLSKLSREDREVLQLKFGAELDNRQIGKLLGYSESNVGTRLWRAAKRLKSSFQETWNGKGSL